MHGRMLPACLGCLFGTERQRMKMRHGMSALVLVLAGCVGLDTAGVKPRGDLPVGDLTNEQVAALKSAAAAGEPSLIATAARMAWESPDDAVSLANYAANLIPERSAEIAEAVAHTVRR